ncbi:uncharacterized [Tachysurus ichikawai]
MEPFPCRPRLLQSLFHSRRHLSHGEPDVESKREIISAPDTDPARDGPRRLVKCLPTLMVCRAGRSGCVSKCRSMFTFLSVQHVTPLLGLRTLNTQESVITLTTTDFTSEGD